MEFVQSAMLLVACLAGAASASRPGRTPATPGIAPGLHRRLDGVGFVSPQEDDFFADYKDLVTPPKDLLETPKDLLDSSKDLTETPDDLVDTPKDLVDTPKDLLDEEQSSDDFEQYAQHGSAQGAQGREDGDDEESHHPDDTSALHEQADLSLAKHLKDSDKSYGDDRPQEDYGEDPSSGDLGDQSSKTPASLEQTHLRSPYDQAGLRSPYDHADVRSRYEPVEEPKPVKETSYRGHHGSRGTAARPAYAYRYGVHDPTTKDVKSAWEQRDGEDTRGGYALVEPDGHTRVVEYLVTKKGGFKARVKRLPPGFGSHH